MNVLLSIKPEFGEAILNGNKTYEFRRTSFRDPNEVERVFIYATAPVQKIIGSFTIQNVINDSPGELWERFGDVSGIEDRNRFMDYFEGKESGYAIGIESISQFERAIDPREYIDDFHPPVSFTYLKGQLAKLLYRFV